MTISRTAVSAAVAVLACTTAWLGRGTLRRVLGEGLASVPWLRPESLKTLFPGLSPCMCLVLPSVLVVAYFGYVLCFSPMNRVRLLGELGYVPDGKVDMQKMSKLVQRRRQTGDVPPVYPNGWFGILESRGLKAGNVRSVCVLGLDLAVFREAGGSVHAVDAYCPHQGANMAVGGRVHGRCIECPFHGWRFDGATGKCSDIPYSDSSSIPSLAKVKSYPVLERNGFVYVWHHAEGVEPYWTPPVIDEIQTGQWSWRGRTEHVVNAHIQEIPENGADIAHLSAVHGACLMSGIDLSRVYDKWWSFSEHMWNAQWTPNTEADERHIASIQLTHVLEAFGYQVSLFNMKVFARQIGPGIVYLTFETPFGRGAFLQALTPVGPLMQRMIHHIYMERWIPTIIAKFYLLGEALMFERDIMIWNNKRYASKPVLVKSKEDSLVQQYRRWYTQFYSEHSPRFTLHKDTLDW